MHAIETEFEVRAPQQAVQGTKIIDALHQLHVVLHRIYDLQGNPQGMSPVGFSCACMGVSGETRMEILLHNLYCSSAIVEAWSDAHRMKI